MGCSTCSIKIKDDELIDYKTTNYTEPLNTKPDKKYKKKRSSSSDKKKSPKLKKKTKKDLLNKSPLLKKLISGNSNNLSLKYNILEKIGSGSYGKVYKVENNITKEIRALKVIEKESILFQDDEQEFLKEIEILSQIDHPNILKIFEFFFDKNSFYMVTELCEGGELYDTILKFNGISEIESAKIMEQLFSAVNYIHSMGIVHRDLKPENILIEEIDTEEIFVKIIDFGTSNYFNNKIKLHHKIGTSYYMAPEVINKNYTNKCDMWSLGVILYTMLASYPPFQGENDIEIMRSVKKGVYNLETPEFQGISEEAKDLIRQLLTYDPEKRISAESAWKHPWIRKLAKYKRRTTNFVKKTLSLGNLKTFGSFHKFQQATIAFLVHQSSASSMVKEIREIFKQFDTEGLGKLTHEQIKKGLQEYYKNGEIAEKEYDSIIKVMKSNDSKFIEFEEFLKVMVRLELLMTDENLRLAFNFFDKDNKKKLSKKNIKDIIGLYNGNEERKGSILDSIERVVDDTEENSMTFENFKEIMVQLIG